MASLNRTMRPLGCWKATLRHLRQQKLNVREFASLQNAGARRVSDPPQLMGAPFTAKKPLKVYSPPPSTRKVCKDPVKQVNDFEIALLDPTGIRTRLFNRMNKEGAKVGDVLLVSFRSGDPFAGVCLNIRRRGADTAILLRNQLTRVGVEMWVKIYSPNVVGIEVAQKREKRARRARLYYMRKPEHDMGSVQNIVQQYLRRRAALRSGAGEQESSISYDAVNVRVMLLYKTAFFLIFSSAGESRHPELTQSGEAKVRGCSEN
ncbi:MAG: hypothetical protein M1834_004995 [Cirrosporium novae-zelandiae]|nr:MAG: hypothetical protein M1834_004995 [Cirrosporium novae-zelandiae]